MGVIYKEKGHLEEAIQEFQTALRIKPGLAEAYYNLGESYEKTGRIPEATHAFEQALQIKPDYDKVRKALHSLSR